MTKLDKVKALELKISHGLTYEEIGQLHGVSKQAVHEALQPLLPNKHTIEQFQKNRADIFSQFNLTQLERYYSLTVDEQKSMLLRRGMVDMGIVYDKERIERGLATSIVSHPEIEAKITTLRQEREDIKAQRELLEREIIDIEGCVGDE